MAESAAFYTTWLHGDEEVGTRMVGSYLEPGAQQSPASHKWLKIWNELITADEKYRERIRRHYRLFKNKETREDFASPEQYGISSPAPALPDAEAELAGVLRLYDIEKYVSIDHIRTWLEMLDVDDHDYMAPFAILMGLAAEWKDASRETTEDVIGAVRTFCNSLPRKKLLCALKIRGMMLRKTNTKYFLRASSIAHRIGFCARTGRTTESGLISRLVNPNRCQHVSSSLWSNRIF